MKLPTTFTLTFCFSLAWTASSLSAPTSAARKALSEATSFPRTWVPLGSTYELDPDRPTPIQFLNQDYICYRDNNGQWIVMDDSCPHRLAPLSEGRIDRDKDRIECSYHGWAFDNAGKCKEIPQLTAAAPGRDSPRACVATYPVVEHKSILWFWPWADTDPLSVASDPSAHPEGMLQGVANYTTVYTRNLPYSWATLLENLIDPAHVPWAHHGLQGSRSDAIPINMTRPVMKENPERGFVYEWEDRTMKMMRAGTADFRAPYTITYDGNFVDTADRKFDLCTLCVPIKPGWSRIMVVTADAVKMEEQEKRNNPGKKAKKKSLFSLIFRMLPVWVIHQFSNRFLDSDMAFLHYQERKRSRLTGDGGASGYYMPAPSDRGVTALHKWLKEFAASAPKLPSSTDYEPRSILFDREVQHTSHCKHCQNALAGIQKWRRNTYGMLALSVLATKQFWAASLVSVLCLGMLWTLASIEPSFKQGEFKHYQNH